MPNGYATLLPTGVGACWHSLSVRCSSQLACSKVLCSGGQLAWSKEKESIASPPMGLFDSTRVRSLGNAPSAPHDPGKLPPS